MDFSIQPINLLQVLFKFTMLDSDLFAIHYSNFYVSRINSTHNRVGNAVELFIVFKTCYYINFFS
jgi:hypothetical protein